MECISFTVYLQVSEEMYSFDWSNDQIENQK